MALTKQVAKKASQVSKEIVTKKAVANAVAKKTKSVKLTNSMFNIVAEALNKLNSLKNQTQAAEVELQKQLMLITEGAGHKSGDFVGVNLNQEAKTLELRLK